MSVIFNVSSQSGAYQIQIGSDLKIRALTKNSFLIVDEKVAKLWSKSLPPDIFTILALEKNKTLLSIAHIIEEMRSKGVQRGANLVAIGGGIIQDLATITASLYMRGIDWSYYPTTLLGMVDSCIGGKSSINVGSYKNIAGNFYPPKKVIIDVEYCNTLTLPEQIAGLCEAVKICFASTSSSFEQYINDFSGLSLPMSNQHLLKLVELSLVTKKWFIEEDEFDAGPRLLLNFGHTFGHAIEAATNFSITHGVAVGFGMLAEIHMWAQLKRCEEMPVRAKKLDAYIRELFKQIPGVINNIQSLNVDLALQAFKSDKKHSDQFYIFVTCDENGSLQRLSVPASHESNQVIEETFEWLKRGPWV